MSKKKQRDLEFFIVDIFVAVDKIKRYTLKFLQQLDSKIRLENGVTETL